MTQDADVSFGTASAIFNGMAFMHRIVGVAILATIGCGAPSSGSIEFVWRIDDSAIDQASCDAADATQVAISVENSDNEVVHTETDACSASSAIVTIGRGTYSATGTLERADGSIVATSTVTGIVVNGQVNVQLFAFTPSS